MLDNYQLLYIPMGGLAGCCLYHALYNDNLQYIYKSNISNLKFYINPGSVIGLSIGIARYYTNKPLLYYITIF